MELFMVNINVYFHEGQIILHDAIKKIENWQKNHKLKANYKCQLQYKIKKKLIH